MRPWLVLPVKGLSRGKSRLAPHMTSAARRRLNFELLSTSLALAAKYPGIARTVVVSSCQDVLEMTRQRGALPLPEDACGLNKAIEQAIARIGGAAKQEILILSCDIPFAHATDLRALVERSRIMGGAVVLATDRGASGTNALCVPPGAQFRFAFGRKSRQRHERESARQLLPCCVLRETSLAFDIDTIDDYREWQQTRTAPTSGAATPPLYAGHT